MASPQYHFITLGELVRSGPQGNEMIKSEPKHLFLIILKFLLVFEKLSCKVIDEMIKNK